MKERGDGSGTSVAPFLFGINTKRIRSPVFAYIWRTILIGIYKSLSEVDYETYSIWQ